MKPMKFFLIVLFLSIFLTNCNFVDKKNYQIIDGIQLGTTTTKYAKQLDSIGIENREFFTTLFLNNIDEIDNNKINVYYSEIFNLSEFKKNSNHFAILRPTTRTGTDNVIGLTAILGHTAHSMIFAPDGVVDLTKKYDIEHFSQNISKDLMNKIKEMITSKYGQPIYKGDSSEYNTFFVLKQNEIEQFEGVGEIQGPITKWENDYLEIELFEGVPSCTAVLNENGYQLSEPVFNTQIPKIKSPDKSKGERQCVSYVYVKYDLKQDITEKLKLNDKKL